MEFLEWEVDEELMNPEIQCSLESWLFYTLVFLISKA